MKKYLFLMLAIFLPATTFSQTLIDGVYYYLFNDGEAYVAENPEASGAVVIPESVIFAGNAYNVTRIYNKAFKDCTGLTSISIPDGVLVIEEDAFSGCTQLASIVFPSNLNTIGSDAFKNCSKLTSIVLPDGVTTIGSGAFGGCTKIASVSFPSSLISVGSRVIDTGSTWYKNQTNNSVVYAGTVALRFKGTIPATISITDGTIVIADEAFSGFNTTLTRVNIPASVRHIGNSAFSNKTNLFTIYFYSPNNLQSIGLNAFSDTQYGNSNMGVSGTVGYIGNIAYKFNGTMPADTELVLKSGTVAIAGGAFSGCTGLKSITIPNTVTNIGRQAFYGCTALESITIPSSVTTIDYYAFYGSGLTSVTIPNTVTNLSPGLFYNCRRLESATISDGIERIPRDLFADCEYLETVAIPSSVKIIERGAFSYCALTSINIPENVVIIENDAFFQQSDDWNYNVSPATSLELPACVAKIGDRAFGNLKKITSVTALMETPVAIGENTFYNYMFSKATLTVPAKSRAAYQAAAYWQNFSEIIGIGKVDQTLDLVAIPTKTYGDAAFSLPATTEEGLTLTWSVANTNVATVSSNVFTIKGAGTTTVTATQAGNDEYEAFSREFTLTVNAKNVSNLTINSISAVTYSGSAKTPTVTVKDGSTTLTSGTDYTVSYSNNINAGTATATITGKGNYTGTKSANFTINAKSASSLTINSISAVTYSGSAKTPTVTVKDGSTTLTSGTDYTVSYSNNINAGTATVTITGMGNYTGTKNANFTINPKNASNLTISSIAAQTYSGSAKTPTVTVKDGSTTLTSGTHYTVAYSNNTNAGTATVTITGMGNYTGTKNANFTINAKGASNLTISEIAAVTYNGSAQTPTVTVKDGSTTLTNGTHYTVAYSNNTNAGTATVTVTGKGNYTSTISANFTINPKNASNLTINSIAAQTYSGSAKTPTVTVKDGSTTLTSGTHYTVAYSNNTNAGTATVTITGKGNYTGTKSANFTINPKNASNLTINSIAAQTYSGSAKTPTVTVKDGTTTLVSGTDYTVSYSNNINAGTATVTITGMGNYTSTKNANFTINKALLTITANSYTINQKEDLPAFEVEYSGFVNGEDESVLTTQPRLTCVAENSETVGTYDITPSGASATNYSFNYVKGTLTVNAVESVTIAMKTGSGADRTMIGYSSQYNLDFTGINDVKAYIVIGFTDTKGVLMARVNVVPANTGIVLKSDVAGVEVEVPTTTSDMYYANLLKPAVKNVTIYPTEDIDAVNYTNLMVGTLNNQQMGFVTLPSSKAYSNKCYLQVPTAFYNGAASAREGGLEMEFVDTEITDIRSLMHKGSATNDAYYDLQGRKVTPVKKGLYIHNGKKVIVK